ncbi:hypothetical protein Micbo1qcDRAFT_235110 [Microdochium bolleyi]|uniref:Protein sip5 n=1 Tax=Microdochium bolleyi TaxID=196109 RepID=A0A136IYC2_9PEZI|nr:hypothetical protein Micbo1qcDRAFT_235110 [Microdochium bolleyi]
MGNAQAKEARASARHGQAASPIDSAPSSARHADRHDRSSRRQSSRPDLAALGFSAASQQRSRSAQPEGADAPFERRETKQEREARRLERERVNRLKERERSMQEEHVDGGYLVTTGIYTASEDFSKTTVRHLQIERRLAPFWRGLDDFRESWVEHQIIAAARGLDIPPADEIPDNLRPQPFASPSVSTSNLNSLTVPMGPRTMSASSDKTGSPSGSALPSPTVTSSSFRPSSSFKPKKALGAVLSLTRNSSNTELAVPREVNAPSDPFVNGQPLEVFLYKQGIECPLCLMYYPQYLNRTRCCDQLICSECFVQIKRPDPHYPEQHGDDEGNANGGGSSQAPSTNTDADEAKTGELIMEPAKCPYCTQLEFGVTYDAPPFRRGVVYAMGGAAVGSLSNAMSSTSSLNSGPPPTSSNPVSRKRGQSLSAVAPNVITTDRIRPEWTTKLAAARAQQRRRAAAADALHHAAFFQPEQQPRTLFGRSSRFSRRNTRDLLAPDSPTSGHAQGQNTDSGVDTPGGPEPGPRGSSGRGGRERFDASHLESLMMAEAIRLSLADEEDRRKKAEKDAKKEAKKREKEERKAAKRNTVYGGPSASGSASSSSLNLPFGRKRGNSGASNLRFESSSTSLKAPTSAPMDTNPGDKGKGVDRGGDVEATTSTAASTAPISIAPATLQATRGKSHLRQMSNASSIDTSDVDSAPGSYMPRSGAAEDPHASGTSLAGRSGEEGENANSPESLFNFQSLAEMVGVHLDGEPESPASEQVSPKGKEAEQAAEVAHEEHVEDASAAAAKATLAVETTETKTDESNRPSPIATLPTPILTLTPETPTVTDANNVDKQLGTAVRSTKQPESVAH